MNAIAIIPARMASSRFPGKPLAPILGRPMIEHVFRRTASCQLFRGVWVATCDREIRAVVEEFGGRVIMTSPEHERASDRVAEAAEGLEAHQIVMVQGDEPMVAPAMLADALAPLQRDDSVGCANLVKQIDSREDFEDPNTIKVVGDVLGNALYFSRSPIPSRSHGKAESLKVFKQVCVIGFQRSALLEYATLPPTPLEEAESIDMLRMLEHGRKVRLVETTVSTHAVDTPEDLVLVESMMGRNAGAGGPK